MLTRKRPRRCKTFLALREGTKTSSRSDSESGSNEWGLAGSTSLSAIRDQMLGFFPYEVVALFARQQRQVLLSAQKTH